MRIRNRTSHMTGLPEGEPQRSPGSYVTKWIYFAFIAGIVIYLIYSGVGYVTHVTGRGYVEIEKVVISSNRGGRIVEMMVSNGDAVTSGQLLAKLDPAQNCVEEIDSRGDKLGLEIRLNKSSLASLQGQLKVIEGQMGDEGIRRALEIERDYARLNNRIRDEANDLRIKIARLKQEIRIQEQQLQQHQAQVASIQPDERCLFEELHAPSVAQVFSIARHTHEVVERGIAIMRLVPEHAAVFIDAYLENDDLRYVQPGKELNVEFPDGKLSLGVVTTVQSAASDALERRWNGYDPGPTRIIARLKPIDDEARRLWLGYDRMEVLVRGNR